jgi:hypothetical protein
MKIFISFYQKHLTAILAFGLLLFTGLACDFQDDSDWKREFGGKKLTFVKTSGSIGDRVDIWFCDSGEYAKRTEFNGFSGGGGDSFSMAGEDFEQGRWTIEAGVLILKSNNGEQSSYDISQGNDANVIRLNGKSYLATRHQECR